MFRIRGLRLPPFLFLLTSLSPPSLPQKKEKSESERLLTEQLQAKEWELLQLKTEMETSQGTGRAHGVNFLLCIIITSNTVFVHQITVSVYIQKRPQFIDVFALQSAHFFFLHLLCLDNKSSFVLGIKCMFCIVFTITITTLNILYIISVICFLYVCGFYFWEIAS